MALSLNLVKLPARSSAPRVSSSQAGGCLSGTYRENSASQEGFAVLVFISVALWSFFTSTFFSWSLDVSLRMARKATGFGGVLPAWRPSALFTATSQHMLARREEMGMRNAQTTSTMHLLLREKRLISAMAMALRALRFKSRNSCLFLSA